ncbi:MAG: bifunctional shikimate kinase/3-dehydroquinate synthase [Candidatus Limnocylindrales bacterium]
MDLVLVGLPGSGKTAVGRRLASRHGATFIDLDDEIERASGASVPEIFADEGEAGFRRFERAAVTALGPADAGSALRRVISPGGGAVVDPRNRWSLFRGRRVAWLDVRPEVIAQRLRRSPVARPLVQGPDPLARVRALAAARERFYAGGSRINGVADVAGVLGQLEALLALPASGATTLLHALTPIGEVVLGEGMAVDALDGALRRLRARRAVLVSEPGAWSAAGEGIASGLRGAGWAVEPLMLPPGEDAKRLAVIEDAARALARLRLERGEPLVAIGGGALGDPAGFLAAAYARGVPWIQVPTTLVAQVDSSIGGKTGVDLPEGKNLLGAFHHPAAIVLDVALLRTLPERQLRAAMGEIVKMAALGDEALFATVDADGAAIAHGDAAAFEGGAVAEVVERAAWAKIEVVIADEREQGGATGRVALNLGHTVAHAIEAVDGYATLMHGEAVGYGLRAATRVGTAIGVTPPDRAERIERALDRLSLGVDPLPYPPEAVVAATGTDKKHAGGRLRWVLPTADGYVTRDDIPEPPVREVVAGVLAGRGGRAA